MTRASDEKTRSHAFDVVPAGHPRVIVFWDGGTLTRELTAGADLVLGRGDDCDIQILHKSVSRRHAVLRAGPPVVLEDLGSANGTRVNGAGIAGPFPLAPGHVAEVGAAFVVLQGDASAPAPAAASTAQGQAQFEHFLALIAVSPLSVLIVGETGVGKEATAETIHRRSRRASGPMVRINCASFPQSLLEGELFGYEKGAFTGALQAKPGLIESANGGTLFLDEVGEMAAATQAALLRVLESRQVLRLGALRPVPADGRIVSATNRDLQALVGEGKFRRDLYYRLAGVTVHVQPLRARRERILPLARELLGEAAQAAGVHAPSLSPAAVTRLHQHDWPGNIRELRNVIERALALSEGRAIEPQHLLLDAVAQGDGAVDERQRVAQALEAAGGHQSRAAEILGVSRRTLINRMEEYGLPRPRKRGA
ncbi:MAG TPA: sigma 54-interacting transcriptional regulator [Polyangiaceae bacterium]|jgi:DNA-binding NtrC family response regulator|nr:sigma 54-interacting transcriptional regulator [Polyangiaceae bacterium]